MSGARCVYTGSAEMCDLFSSSIIPSQPMFLVLIFPEIVHESDQGAVMVPAVWWQCRLKSPEASPKKEGKRI